MGTSRCPAPLGLLPRTDRPGSTLCGGPALKCEVGAGTGEPFPSRPDRWEPPWVAPPHPGTASHMHIPLGMEAGLCSRHCSQTRMPGQRVPAGAWGDSISEALIFLTESGGHFGPRINRHSARLRLLLR